MPLDPTDNDYDADIEQLEAALENHQDLHPNTYGRLRISNTSLRASTKRKWKAYNWKVTDEEIKGICNGNDGERKKALISLLKDQYVHEVEIVKGVGTIEIEVLPDVVDEV